ncbi:MAG TPA: hypothetical protein VK969_06410, partial [Acidimicrobiia bacterium]|nr:hypothetical protein [Acidimicrobiia bacterium]
MGAEVDDGDDDWVVVVPVASPHAAAMTPKSTSATTRIEGRPAWLIEVIYRTLTQETNACWMQ